MEGETPDVIGRGTLNGINCVENPRDLATIHEALRRWPKRWRGQPDAMKDAVVQDVDAGRRAARAIMDDAQDAETTLAAADRIFTAARVHLMIEAQNQSDEHLAVETDKKNAPSVQVNVVQVNGDSFRNV